MDIGTTEGKRVEAPADSKNLRSPENYLGYGRKVDFASPGGFNRNQSTSYSFPTAFTLNQWGLAGAWHVSESSSRSAKSNVRLAIRFHARDFHVVMGAANGTRSIVFRVPIEGQPPGYSHGIGTDEEGYGTVSAPRLCQLIRQIGPIRDRQF
jgi:hypothetical protein